MRNFSWYVFSVTGDIDAYLLYKASDNTDFQEEDTPSDQEEKVSSRKR
jgi:hypothetical protein